MASACHTQNILQLDVPKTEYWWGGSVRDGGYMPFTHESVFKRDLSNLGYDSDGYLLPANQASAVLLSSDGRLIWADEPFTFEFQNGKLTVEGTDLHLEETTGSLETAFAALRQKVFPPSGHTPAIEMISLPHYNTWIEMPFTPTQDKVIQYVQRMLEGGMGPGVVIIDDNWARNYGEIDFDPARFPDPQAMCNQLHEWGCKVMLWLVPFISPDTATFRELEKEKILLLDENNQVAIRRWWNGISATIDLSNPSSRNWLHSKLRHLMETYRVDGFKFDAGDMRDYCLNDKSYSSYTPAQQSAAWSEFAREYSFNEIRACWGNGGQPIAQRLEDKPPAWGPYGIESLIPSMIAQALIGHCFVCPDMVGGGEINAMQAAEIDQEFFVRYAQVAALSPMMQFSTSPKRLLDETHFAAILRALEIRKKFMPLLLELASEAAETGLPILRPLAIEYPQLSKVNDQFMLGESVLVAPVVKQGAKERIVILPPGQWVDDKGVSYQVESDDFMSVSVDTPIERLPYFIKKS